MAKYRVFIKDFSVIVKRRLSYYEQINERELNYLSQNQISGLFHVAYDGKKCLTYQAPPAVSIKKYLKKNRLSETSFWKIVSQMVDTAIAVEGRGLPGNHLLIEDDMMFIQEDTLEMFLIFQPVVSPHMPTGLFAFLHDMVYQEIKNGGGMQQDYLINFQNYLLQSGYELTRVQSYIKQEAPWLKTEGYVCPDEKEGQESRQVKKSSYGRQQEKERHTIPLSGSEETDTRALAENINSDADGSICITRVKDGRSMELSGDVLHLGRSPQCHYCIKGNPAIGRTHAVIKKHADGYYIIDTGSVNKTYLKNMPLTIEQPYQLHHGDTIRLADEEFIIEFSR